jgi:hypothetical protein
MSSGKQQHKNKNKKDETRQDGDRPRYAIGWSSNVASARQSKSKARGSTAEKDKPMNSTAKKIHHALELNLKLQKDIEEKVRAVYAKQRSNREAAAQSISTLYEMYEKHLVASTPAVTNNPNRKDDKFYKEFAHKLNQVEAKRAISDIEDVDVSSSGAPKASNKKRKRSIDGKTRKQGNKAGTKAKSTDKTNFSSEAGVSLVYVLLARRLGHI